MFRKAGSADLAAIERIYEEVHTAEETGRQVIGWIRDVYPTGRTAKAALDRGDLFVLEEKGQILGAAVINQIQVDVYEGAPWEHEGDVCVLHTLVISPNAGRKGLGKKFVSFYEQYAYEHGCMELRMDTNARNQTARAMYRKLGYREIAIVPTVFNGIPGVDLVLLEKHLQDGCAAQTDQ